MLKKKKLGLVVAIIMGIFFLFSNVISVEAKKSDDIKLEQVTKEQKKALKKETKAVLKKYSIKDDTSNKLKKWKIKKDSKDDEDNWTVTVKSKKNKKIISKFKWNGNKKEQPILVSFKVNKKDILEQIKQEKKQVITEIKKNYSDLANLEYANNQTIEVNNNSPNFTADDLLIKEGAWETYGDLDSLNRVTAANAMLNQSLMPTEKRGDISKISPTGWKNKEIKGGYLYNRSHLIGFALSGENANWKNLMTGTRQLNSPEMLRHEMDVKEYLERSKDNFVRYRVTPIFRGDELLARGVQMEAQSIDSKDIRFNVFIFNVQEGVNLNYADGSSTVNTEYKSDSEKAEIAKQQEEAAQAAAVPQQNTQTESSEQQYVDENGNGLIKGSNSGIYHVPGSTYYNRTTNPAALFKTISEAEQAGYRAPKK